MKSYFYPSGRIKSEAYDKAKKYDALLKNYQKAMVKIVTLQDEIDKLDRDLNLWKTRGRGK